jgi:argininosuccinate lyase
VKFLADRLGFSRVTANSIDILRRSDSSRLSHACSMTMAHLSRLAEDAIRFSEEFGFRRNRLGSRRLEPDAAEEESGSA